MPCRHAILLTGLNSVCCGSEGDWKEFARTEVMMDCVNPTFASWYVFRRYSHSIKILILLHPTVTGICTCSRLLLICCLAPPAYCLCSIRPQVMYVPRQELHLRFTVYNFNSFFNTAKPDNSKGYSMGGYSRAQETGHPPDMLLGDAVPQLSSSTPLTNPSRPN